MLKKSKVIFNEKDHTYFLGDNQLQGITKMLSKHLFPNKYKTVSNEIMHKAAEKGSLIHKEVENFIKTGEYGFTSEFYAWLEMSYECYNNTKYYSEFLVSDNKNFATCIDIVCKTDNVITLRDIKTTYALDTEYLSWQLSINAYLFEQQTGEKVSFLAADWLREDKYKYVKINRKSDEEVKALLKAEINGEMYVSKALVLENKEIQCINELSLLLTGLKEQENAVKELIKSKMKEQHIKKATIGNLVFTYIDPTTSMRIDSKLLEKEKPDIYTKYLKQLNVKDSIRIKVSNNE